MGFYNGTALELLCQQIVTDNPGLAGRITPETIVVNGSAVARNANGRNTQITVVGIPGKGLLGELVLSYDRINLTSFTGNLYLPVEISKGVNTYAEALADINAQLGLNLTASDLAAPNNVFTGGVMFASLIISISNASALYTGGLRISWRRAAVGVYPDSGPGTKELRVGDTEFGYFGPVSGTLMPSSQQLVNAILDGSGITPPTIATPTSPDWMKFYYKGKVVFVPKTNMVGTTWDNYYKAGSAYAADDPNGSRYPGTDKVVVAQDKIFPFISDGKAAYFHHRLPRGSTTIQSGASLNGEDYALMAKILGGEWGTEPGTVYLGGGTYYMSQHIYNINQPEFYAIHSMLGVIFGAAIQKAQGYNYVPWLELINPNETVLPVNISDSTLTFATTAVTGTRIEENDRIFPVVFEYVVTLHLTPTVPAGQITDSLSPAVFTTISTQKLTPVVPIGSVVKPPVKTNLSTTNGDLTGFN
ncbi:hypothetical protein pEaSNUABM11_00175 [Erwinia phage pEa_SNUABM_11]|nr:hypothetical protein pEaSNUABM11_00175 [Erwinia phage pEa_SNUABM_11]